MKNMKKILALTLIVMSIMALGLSAAQAGSISGSFTSSNASPYTSSLQGATSGFMSAYGGDSRQTGYLTLEERTNGDTRSGFVAISQRYNGNFFGWRQTLTANKTSQYQVHIGVHLTGTVYGPIDYTYTLSN